MFFTSVVLDDLCFTSSSVYDMIYIILFKNASKGAQIRHFNGILKTYKIRPIRIKIKGE